jgi:GTP-binding protein Era
MNSGIIAIVGRANVGKSTLLNRIVGEKVSIVSPVAQTTRNMIRAVHTAERGQLVFLDTPGMHRAEGQLGKLMNKMARRSAEGVDRILLVLDVSCAPREEDRGWIRRLCRQKVPVTIALNKSDLSESHESEYRKLWKDLEEPTRDGTADPETTGSSSRPATEWIEISARSGSGVDALTSAFFESLPEGPLLFPEELLTDFPRKLAIADIIREKLYAYLRDELPHAVAVHVNKLIEDDEKWTIEADIYVNRSSQKGIVLGAKGRQLREVKRKAARELEEIFERPIDLNLWVTVQKDWTKNFWILKRLGYTP